MGELIETPSLEEQKETVQMLLTKSLCKGETWYLINSKWLSNFKQFIGLEGAGVSSVAHPGPIDNAPLFDENGELRKVLVDKLDYEVVPAECWKLLVEWYGICNGQQPISRKVILIEPTYLLIEVYPVELKCFKNADSKKHHKLVVSKQDSFQKVNNELKKIFHINQNTISRLSIVVGDGMPMEVGFEDTVANVGLSNGSTVIIETFEDGAWPRTSSSRSSKTNNSSNCQKMFSSPNSSIYFGASSSSLSFAGGGRSSRNSSLGTMGSSFSLRQPGVCGLNNLGNTCFMNSVLQCMSNCPAITEYFLAGKHLLELNETNPLGMKGEIAKAYGELIQAMWSGNYATANPLPFKVQVGKFNPTFSGCQQHDSQELLTFLLDGLHEDLNRIKKKPYIEVKDQVSRPDHELANEAWENYRKRNDSIIVDTFHGLLKSRVVCPECERVSVTFDPFCYLSLPLPMKKDRTLAVKYIPFNGSLRENNLKVSVPRKGTVRDLCIELSNKMSCSPDQLLVSEIAHSHFHKFFGNDDSLDKIDEKDVIFVYEIPVALSNDNKIVPVCFWEKVKPVDRFVQNHLFGVPFIAVIPCRPITAEQLNSIIREKMRRHFVLDNDADNVNEDQSAVEQNNAGCTSNQKSFPIYTLDTTRATLNPQPLEYNNGMISIKEALEGNNRSFGRTILIIQMTAEERRDYFREKPADYGPDLLLSQQIREKNCKIQVNHCLSLFTTCEKLSEDDAWYCPACKKHQRATKKFDLWKLPRILIIHLKRFSYTRCRRDKIDSLVEFPIRNLNISQYVINTEAPNYKYDLIGICNHYGTMGGGHYTAFCKNKNSQEWYCFDDNSVSVQSEDNIMSSAAYVLFYMAKSTNPTTPADDLMDIN